MTTEDEDDYNDPDIDEAIDECAYDLKFKVSNGKTYTGWVNLKPVEWLIVVAGAAVIAIVSGVMV